MPITIEIKTTDGNTYELELECSGNENENGIEYRYHGKGEDANGQPIEIDVLQHRNHPTVSHEDVHVSDNVETIRDSIAHQINEQLLGNEKE